MRIDFPFPLLDKPSEKPNLLDNKPNQPDKPKKVKEENASDEETEVDVILPSTLLECNLDSNVLDVHKRLQQPIFTREDSKVDNENEEKTNKGAENEFVDEVLDEIDKSTLIDVDYVKNDMVINTENYSNANAENDSSIRMLCFFKNIKCAYCSKVYIMKNDLKHHLVEDHDSSKQIIEEMDEVNEQFECTVCNIKFDFAIDLTHHTAKEHTKYECEICNKVYLQAYNLKRHVKTCQPPAEKGAKAGRGIAIVGPIICDLCDKVFKRNWNLKQHKQNIHKITNS